MFIRIFASLVVLAGIVLAFQNCGDDGSNGCLGDCDTGIVDYNPKTSPAAGGGVLSVTGNRMSLVSITIGGQDCPITDSSLTLVECTIPAGAAGPASSIRFVDSGDNVYEVSGNAAFIYE